MPQTVFSSILTVIILARITCGFDVPAICNRLPNNTNCLRSRESGERRSGAPSNGQPAANQGQANQPPPGQPQPQTQPQLQPQPQPSIPQPQSPNVPRESAQQPPTPEDMRQACISLKQKFDAHCVPGATVSMDVKSYCDLYVERCISTGLAPATAPVAPSPAAALPQGQIFDSKWKELTRQGYQKEQLQQVDSTEKWLYDCGTYNLPYNALCYPNASNFFCNTLRRVCLSHAEDLAAGQTPVNGPFPHNNGLPTGGAGSSRPVTWGKNVGVGPFFNLGNNKAVNPLQGFGNSAQLQVPIAGVGATISKGADYGGIIGLNQLGQLLDGRRRRRRTVKQSDLVNRFRKYYRQRDV